MHDLAAAAALLESSEDFKVLRRFVPRRHYNDEPWNLGDRSQVKLGLFVDTETTDLDTARCDIIEFGAVQFSYNAADGVVYSIVDEYQGFEEPRQPISDEAQAKHGITLDMVRGQNLDEEKIFTMLASSHLVIAHNAGFDRPVLERRISAFEAARFACSYREVEWDLFGCVGAKLENILAATCREFYDAHRALDDCRVGVHVLASAQFEGTPALQFLLDSARKPTIRVWAIGSPFSVKDALKARGYRWSDGSRGPKSWYRDCTPDDSMVEMKWLRENAGVANPTYTEFDAKTRYSVRAA